MLFSMSASARETLLPLKSGALLLAIPPAGSFFLRRSLREFMLYRGGGGEGDGPNVTSAVNKML